ncbi:phosphoserine phosphatase [Corynebacterium sp. HMSC11E11]|nr:phosphoserine phosphatase [Corynebacterium sp. HMSC11E11]
MLDTVTVEDPRHKAAPRPASTVAAFFDLDKTIIARSSAYAFGRQFMESGLLSASGMMQMALGQAMYISGGHDHDQMEAARDQLSAMVTGWRADHVRHIAEESLHQVISPYVYKEAIDLIRHHRALGHDVYVVSASAAELVEPIAAELGVRETVATRLEVVDGVYTGEVPFFCRGGNKATELRRIAAERGYDLSRCYAYSDSGTDEPMLSVVGHPVAVNPDKALRKIAEEREWPIRIFRSPVPLFRRTGPRVTGIAAVAAGAAALVAGIIASRRGGGDA